MTAREDGDRRLIRVLAFAGREFDRAREALLADDEHEQGPGDLANGSEATADGNPADARREPSDADQPATALQGIARGGQRVASAAAGAATGVARAAGRKITGSIHPRHPDWPTATLDERVDWWVERFGTAAAALTAVPGAFGALSRVSGAGNVIGAAAQILIVNAVAAEAGVDDPSRRIAAAAHIVLGRELDRGVIETTLAAPEDVDPETQNGDADPGDLTAEEDRRIRTRLGRTARLVWRVARELWRLNADIDNRPQGGFVLRTMRNLPAVGAASAFISERKGIARAADAARLAFAAPVD
ncbi:MAG: hypothetical protein V9G19_19745 [Tetrasphaera sp.]